MATRKRSARKPLVCQHLEGLSRAALERHQDLVKEHVRGRHGVYALYRRERLYYVGLASNLRGRLKQHLKDRHGAKWDRFSVYLTIGHGHLRELESLVLRIVRPEGNTQRGRFAQSEDLKRTLARDMKRFYRRQMDDLLGRTIRVAAVNGRTTRRGSVAAPSRRGDVGRQVPLAGLRGGPFRIRCRYHRTLHHATVRRDGRIRLAGKLFDSPSKAGSHVRDGKPTNGWTFWQYERAPGDWVRLTELRRG